MNEADMTVHDSLYSESMRESAMSSNVVGSSSIMTEANKKKIFLKVVVIGDKNVGKTSLIQ